MNKEYIKCKHAMTSSCPSRFHKDMIATLSGDSNKNITDEIIDNANSLCADCQEFTLKTQ